MRALLIADDLTGAADSAAAFASLSAPVRIVPAGSVSNSALDEAIDHANTTDGVLVIETDTRDEWGEEAASRLRQAVSRRGLSLHSGWTFKKIDSMLRGPIAAETGVLHDAGFAERVVCAPALPARGRFTIGGRQLLGTQPVHSAVGADPRTGPRSSVVAQTVGLDPTRDGVTIYDARTDADLDAVIARLPDPPHHPTLLLIGTAGLAAALARRLRTGAPAPTGSARSQDAACGPILLISLSPNPVARGQVEQVLARWPPAVRIVLTPDTSPTDRAAQVKALDRAHADGSSLAVLTVDTSGSRHHDADALRAAIMSSVHGVLAHINPWPRIIANGGDACRCVVDTRVDPTLEVQEPAAEGAVRCWLRSDYGQPQELITKSGGFGGHNTLIDIIETMTPDLRVSG